MLTICICICALDLFVCILFFSFKLYSFSDIAIVISNRNSALFTYIVSILFDSSIQLITGGIVTVKNRQFLIIKLLLITHSFFTILILFFFFSLFYSLILMHRRYYSDTCDRKFISTRKIFSLRVKLTFTSTFSFHLN